jgi:RNA polymerase sigma-70 factor, ECF subfamily
VVLSDIEGFSYAEMAEIMDVPMGTVMSRLHRGRKVLQKRLWAAAKDRGIVKETILIKAATRLRKRTREAVVEGLDRRSVHAHEINRRRASPPPSAERDDAEQHSGFIFTYCSSPR